MTCDPDGRPAKWLVAYYGLIEAVHIGVLAAAGLRFGRTGLIGFPAPPPAGGWAPQLTPFFIAMATIDAVNVGVAWLFVYGYFTGARWRWVVGCATLTASLYSAIVFAGGTIASGAWGRHPAGYLAMAAAYAPVAALAVLLATWVARGRLRSGASA